MLVQSLQQRKALRRDHGGTILTVRCLMFVLVPMLYLAYSTLVDPGHVEHQVEPAFHSRNLLSLSGRGKNCTPAAILEFPSDGFTRQQRRSGWIAVHCLLACYCFVLLAQVCDNYFVPSIETMCSRFKVSEDVAGATFMAAASSSPELFINSVGTFVTEGDIGVGTIVGSAVFNILAVPACCGLLGGQVVELDWWAVSRDSLMYGVAVVSLIFTLQDDKVQWYEATALVGAYTFYILTMYFNGSLSKIMRSSCCIKKPSAYTEVTPLLSKDKKSPLDISTDAEHGISEKAAEAKQKEAEDHDDDEPMSIWSWPDSDVSGGKKLFWIVTWPMNFVLWATIPNCRKYKSLYIVTFLMCICWIGVTSYVVAWLITAIGDTIDIPDSVMGLTFLAAGTSVPEAVSSVIVTNQGHGSMGISSSIGSNTFDILLCLGLPWFIKSIFYPTNPGEYWVNINSSGLTYNAISLLSTLLGLYISFACNKFLLDWKIGLTCTFMYMAFLVMASLIELNVFFPVNLPTCAH